MAEICFTCFQKTVKINLKSHEIILSKELDFCEFCNVYTHTVIRQRVAYRKNKSFAKKESQPILG